MRLIVMLVVVAVWTTINAGELALAQQSATADQASRLEQAARAASTEPAPATGPSASSPAGAGTQVPVDPGADVEPSAQLPEFEEAAVESGAPVADDELRPFERDVLALTIALALAAAGLLASGVLTRRRASRGAA